MKRIISIDFAAVCAAVLFTGCYRPESAAASSFSVINSATDETAASFITDSTTVPSETDAPLVGTTTVVSRTKKISAATTAKKKPVTTKQADKPTTPTRLKRAGGHYMDAYILMDTGDVYRWDFDTLQKNADGQKMGTLIKRHSGMKDYRLVTMTNCQPMEMLLDTAGNLFVCGRVPSRTETVSLTSNDYNDFAPSHTREQVSPQKIAEGVKSIVEGAYLTNSGDVYLYGIAYGSSTGKSFAQPQKIMNGVDSLCGNLHRLFAITTAGDLLAIGDLEGGNWEAPLKLASQAACITIVDETISYVSRSGDFFILDKPQDGSTSYRPRKISAQVKQGIASRNSYVYLTLNNTLYASFSGEPAVKIATRVKDFTLAGALLYRDQENHLYGSGVNMNCLRGIEGDPGRESSNRILSGTQTYSVTDLCAYAMDAEGNWYTWGANSIGLRTSDGHLQLDIATPLLLPAIQ